LLAYTTPRLGLECGWHGYPGLQFSIADCCFGNLPMAKENFPLVILAIVVLSLMLGIIEFIRHRQQEPIK